MYCRVPRHPAEGSGNQGTQYCESPPAFVRTHWNSKGSLDSEGCCAAARLEAMAMKTGFLCVSAVLIARLIWEYAVSMWLITVCRK